MTYVKNGINIINKGYNYIKKYSNEIIPFIIKVNSGANNRFTITKNTVLSYDYNIKVVETDTTYTNIINNFTIIFPLINTIYTLEISGLIPGLRFNSSGNAVKLLSIEQWGNNPWQDCTYMFVTCSNLICNASDNADMSQCISMRDMFYNAWNFNGDISGWNVSSLLNMNRTFARAYTFNQDIGAWNISKVNTMSETFFRAYAFNQDIGAWDTSNVTNMFQCMPYMLVFNHDIGNWNVSKVTNMVAMFSNSLLFNQDLSRWDVSRVTNYVYFDLNTPAWVLPKPIWI